MLQAIVLEGIHYPQHLPALSGLGERGMCSGQPEGHPHLVEERNGGGQFAACRCQLASLGRQGPERQVAVGLEWTHPEFLGQREGLLIAGVGCSPARGSCCAWISPWSHSA